MPDSTTPAQTDPLGRDPAWSAHMAGLRASYQHHLGQHPDRKDARIEDLLATTASAAPDPWRRWDLANEIEILMVRLKLGADLDVALDSAVLTAARIAVPSAVALSRSRDAAADDAAKQAVLAALLREIHTRYAGRRSERAGRVRVARRMTCLGFGLTAMIIGVFLALGTGWSPVASGRQAFTDLVTYNLIVTTFFGFLGAFLSRLIAFQNTAVALSVDDLENGYSWHFLMVRLLVGGLSSVIVYFVIAGHLVAGELFPAPAEGATGGFGELWTRSPGALVPYEGPSGNFAKLIVWCFFAGFSERFLPDSLSALDVKGRA